MILVDLFGLDRDSAALGDVDTVQEHTDILVLDSDGLLDGSSGLGDVVEGVALEDDLVLELSGLLDGDTGEHLELADTLLTQEVADLNDSVALSNGKVDREMVRGRTHLVLVALLQKKNNG